VKNQIKEKEFFFSSFNKINDHDDGILYLVNEMIVDVDKMLAL
jgi:hypothetical protein